MKASVIFANNVRARSYFFMCDTLCETHLGHIYKNIALQMSCVLHSVLHAREPGLRLNRNNRNANLAKGPSPLLFRAVIAESIFVFE